MTGEPEPTEVESEQHVGRREHLKDEARGAKSWGGYGWFMSLGTFLPLPVFLGGYLVNVTLVGAPLARQIYRFGVFLSTLGQPPPGKDRLDARTAAGGKKPFAERIRPYSPPGFIEHRGKPVSMAARVIWFILIGWWAGAIWVCIAWSVLLFPYPLLDVIRSLLSDLPSVMTLAWPEPAPQHEAAPSVE